MAFDEGTELSKLIHIEPIGKDDALGIPHPKRRHLESQPLAISDRARAQPEHIPPAIIVTKAQHGLDELLAING